MTSILPNSTKILNTGLHFPLVGFGTFRIRGEETIFKCLDCALENGYRSIDTAACYGNEESIGKALKIVLPKHNLQRKDIFITTKLDTRNQGEGRAARAALESLKKLDVGYIDLFLIHWPGSSFLNSSDLENSRLRRESWHELVPLNKQGVIRNLGVSNYTIRHLEELQKDNLGVIPAVNQVELHPWFQQNELLKYCEKNNILVQAYSSLGSNTTSLRDDPIVKKCAEIVGCTSAQMLLAWALSKEIAVIPKSETPLRIKENIQLALIIPESIIEELNKMQQRKKLTWDPEIVR